MKLTNKILLSALVIIVLLVPVNKLIFKSKVELDPNYQSWQLSALQEKSHRKPGYTLWQLNNIKDVLIRGRYDVHIVKGDSSYMKITGSGEFFTKNGAFSENNNGLSIIPFNNYSGPRINNIQVICGRVNTLRVWKGAIVTLEGFTQKEININAEDSSIVMVKDCSFDTAKVTGKNNCLIFLNKAKNAGLSMMNESRISLSLDGGTAYGSIDKNSDFVLQGRVNKNYIVQSN